ncbi:hypothetical protein ACFL3T_02785 [Patescibacteria group bacterium]
MAEGYHPVHVSQISQFLAECRVARQVTPFQERGSAFMAAVKRGEVVYLVDEEGCAHLNAGHNLREALVEANWQDCVEAIFRVGTRQSVTGELSWAPHLSHTQSIPIRVPDFTATAEAPEEPELAPVIPLVPQQ